MENPNPTHLHAESVLRTIAGNLTCNRSGCHGKGYTGLITFPDGSVKVALCECGRVGGSDFAALGKRIDRLEHMIQVAFRHSFFGGLKVGWAKVAGWVRRKDEPKG